jgi:hypothetical protein
METDIAALEHLSDTISEVLLMEARGDIGRCLHKLDAIRGCTPRSFDQSMFHCPEGES